MTFEVLSNNEGILKARVNDTIIENNDILGNDCIGVMLKNLTAFFYIRTGKKWIIWNGEDCCYLWKLVKQEDDVCVELYQGDDSYQCYYEAVELSETGIRRHLLTETISHREFALCILEEFRLLLNEQKDSSYDDQLALLSYFIYSKKI